MDAFYGTPKKEAAGLPLRPCIHTSQFGRSSRVASLCRRTVARQVQAELEIQMTASRQAEFPTVLDDIRARVAEYGFTEQEIFGRRRGSSPIPESVSPAKYRDPLSGATWSGRERAPNWIKDAKNHDRFLVSDGSPASCGLASFRPGAWFAPLARVRGCLVTGRYTVCVVSRAFGKLADWYWR